MSPTTVRRRLALVLCFALLCPGLVSGQETIHRHGATPLDHFLLCAREVLGRPVAAHPSLYESRWKPPECNRDATALRDSLHRSGVVLFEGTWIYLVLTAALPSVAKGAGRLEVRAQIQNWGEIPGSRQPTAAERALVSDAIFRDARLISYRGVDLGNATMRLEPELTIDIHRLRQSGPESVMAALTRNGAPGRLVYGELQDGKYRLLWDSPFYDVWLGAMSYLDLDADGTQEILLAGRWDRSSKLSVLSLDGRELSRQSPCEFEQLMDGYTADGSLCPLIGDPIDILPATNGLVEIRVGGNRGLGTTTKTYRVVKRQLVAKEN